MLPDSAVVIRGGMMASDFLFEAVEDHEADFPGVLALSVASLPDGDVSDIALHPDADFLCQGKIRVTTVGTLRQSGYDVEEDGAPHALLKLPRRPDEAMWEELRGIFSDIRPNPRPRG